MPINPKRTKGLSFADFAKEVKKSPKAGLRPKKRSKYLGRVHKLSLTDYLTSIFIHNERAAQSQKASDIKIAEMVLKEYMGYKTLTEKWRARPIEEVIYYRNFYNKGDLTNKVPPETLSKRYNAQGAVICSDRSDSALGDIEEWTKKKEAYYTAHQIIRHESVDKVPDLIKNFDWFWDSPNGDDAEMLKACITEISNRSNAMKKRHEEKKGK